MCFEKLCFRKIETCMQFLWMHSKFARIYFEPQQKQCKSEVGSIFWPQYFIVSNNFSLIFKDKRLWFIALYELTGLISPCPVYHLVKTFISLRKITDCTKKSWWLFQTRIHIEDYLAVFFYLTHWFTFNLTIIYLIFTYTLDQFINFEKEKCKYWQWKAFFNDPCRL